MASPAEPFAPNGAWWLGPGNRVDVFLDASLEPGESAPILMEDFRGGWIELGLVYEKGEPVRPAPLGAEGATGQSAAGKSIWRVRLARRAARWWRMAMMMGRGMMGGAWARLV